MIVGKATAKANSQACSQTEIISLTKPTLKTVITNDIMKDISNDIKKEKISL